jgi:hypothetical protein
MATFNLTPSGITSDLTLTVSYVLNRPIWPLLRGYSLQEWMENKGSINFHRFDLGDAGGPIDSRLDDLCNHAGFTDIAALRGCWRHFEEKNPLISLDSQPIFDGKAYKNGCTLSNILFSFICTWFQVNRTSNKRAVSKNRK